MVTLTYGMISGFIDAAFEHSTCQHASMTTAAVDAAKAAIATAAVAAAKAATATAAPPPWQHARLPSPQ
eukprot:359992-Chlamydomonas_euryale.AAC.1